MPDIADDNWSERDDQNAEVAPYGWPPGLPAFIEQIGRMMMGAIKRSWRRFNPFYPTTGTGDAYVVTPASNPTFINIYEIIRVRIDRANTTTTPTLKYGGANARTIKRITPAGKVAVVIGDMVAGKDHGFWYDGTDFILMDPATISGTLVTGALLAANNLSDVLSASTSLTNIGGAPLNSPTFTGIVTIPTGAVIADYAPLASPALTDNPTAPTQAAGNNSTRLATTAYADRMLPLAGGKMTGGINMNSFGLTNLASITLSGATLPLTGLSLAQGDTLYASAANVVNRLAKGTALQLLRMNAGATSPEWVTASLLTSGTAVTLSGTAVDFTGIPAGAKRITVSVESMSTNGTTGVSVQIGDSGGIETTSYACATSNAASSTTEFLVTGGSSAAAGVYSGSVVLTLIDAATNKWAATGITARTDTAGYFAMGGTKATSATLDRIRIKTGNGTDTFDAGSVNILYE